MNIPWWEHLIVFLGALIFVLAWVVKNIDYENLKKWRWNVWSEKWTLKAKLVLIAIIGVCTYSVYRVIIRLSN